MVNLKEDTNILNDSYIHTINTLRHNDKRPVKRTAKNSRYHIFFLSQTQLHFFVKKKKIYSKFL